MQVRLIFVSLCFIAHHAYAGMNGECLIQTGPCSARIEQSGVKVDLDISPKPVSPMKELVFSVSLSDGNGPVTDATVLVDLTMPGMTMGINRPALVHSGDGKYVGKGVLPECMHGGRVWRAEVRIAQGEKTSSAAFTFEVQ